ncbi:hypothetical protein EJB05_50075 [Eragrostis curvula]|uniref:Uncharacterized protein n=1 Tax=Eragrostis curvula TaxID=38414 RepID=A0A5J9T0L5_9POAL|nr:hypothetical protein EJB05_50075 [Eragrostis curvula]
MTVWEPDSDPKDLKEGAAGQEKKAAAAAAGASLGDRDRKFIICVTVGLYANLLCRIFLAVDHIVRKKKDVPMPDHLLDGLYAAVLWHSFHADDHDLHGEAEAMPVPDVAILSPIFIGTSNTQVA